MPAFHAWQSMLQQQHQLAAFNDCRPGGSNGLVVAPSQRSDTGIEWNEKVHNHSAALLSDCSPLQIERREWQPELPAVIRGPIRFVPAGGSSTSAGQVADDSTETRAPGSREQDTLRKLFVCTYGQPYLAAEASGDISQWLDQSPLRIGVVLSGGQAPGGHNVLSGVFDYIKQVNANSQLFGFLNGPAGVMNGTYRELDAEIIARFRNQGGFHMIRSGRHKIETESQKDATLQVCRQLDLHGLVIIGGDDSNTNAALLAEHFRQRGSTISVVGCPKTIDGDLRNEFIEASFGFDTAVKVYSELIGNLSTDVATSKGRYHFVRLMGRSASHIALECALQTRPNLCFIGEEIRAERRSLSSLVDEIVDLVELRHKAGKDYGVILVPEGLIEFIPEIGTLIDELNQLAASIPAGGDMQLSQLSPDSLKIFESLPTPVQKELLLDRDPHGNVQVARVATEKLLISMTLEKLRGSSAKPVFQPTAHYFGYEGRCAMPSNFDARYSYALGHTAAALVNAGKSGYMAVVRDLAKPVAEWSVAGCPLTMMLKMERRKGSDVPVIAKYLVDLEAPLFLQFRRVRETWFTGDFYRNPGPLQFTGPCSETTNYTICGPSEHDLLPPVPFQMEALRGRYNFIKSETYLSPLQRERLRAKIDVAPQLTKAISRLVAGPRCPIYDSQASKHVNRSFPLQVTRHRLRIYNMTDAELPQPEPTARDASAPPDLVATHWEQLRIGVVLQGQQAPGSSNVLHGLYERIRVVAGSRGRLFGFKGITGLLNNDYIELTREDLKLHFNQGGFELLGRTKLTKASMRTDAGLEKVRRTVSSLQLHGLVMIGGQTSLTDAALVAEDFLAHDISTVVVGVPAAQENNLRHSLIEACIGFDSTSKCYSALIGNLLTDAASAVKYWYFVRLMGQVPSHMVLEAAFQTHPNVSVISEKYASEDQTMFDVVRDIADVICERAARGRNFGTVVIPEGLISQLPNFRQLLSQLNELISGMRENELVQLRAELLELPTPRSEGTPDDARFLSRLPPWSRALLECLPAFFREQLIQQSSRIELSEISVEQLFSHLVAGELERRKVEGKYNGTFTPVCHYLGFQGRSTIPSEFDCRLGLAHGYLASVVVEANITGYVTSIRGLCSHPCMWKMSAVPITAIMKLMPHHETAVYGRDIPMVPCADVNVKGRAYLAFRSAEEEWEHEDRFCNPGPIQFSGVAAHFYNRTLFEEQHAYLEMLAQLDFLTSYIESVCSFGIDETTLRTTVLSLEGLTKILRNQVNQPCV